MLSSILFLLSSLLLIISFLLIKKNEKKLNIIKWLCIAFILMFCLNSILIYLFSYIKIPSNLFVISFAYLLISIVIYFKCIKKEKQKYCCSKKDIIYSLIFLSIILIITFIRFGFPFSITYQTFDPGLHFQSAVNFYEESFLLNFVQDNTILNFETWRFASYANLGLIFKFFSPFLNAGSFYVLYILYDVITLFVTAILFYYFVDNGKKSCVKLIGTILFLLGYPLNNLLFGFFYVGHVSCIIMTILHIVKNIDNEKLKYSLLTLLNVGIMFTYYLFVPFVYLAEFLYFIKTKHIVKKYIFLFFIPALLGFAYFVFPTFSNDTMNLIKQIKIDGYFYNDVVSNLLLFLPFISYDIYMSYRERKFSFETIVMICLLVLMLVLNILMLLGVIMPYYVSKYYYILWILCFIILFKVYDNYYMEYKVLINNYLIFIIFAIMISVTDIENTIINLNSGEWNKTNSSKLFNVYSYNLNMINNPRNIFTYDELVDVKKVSANLDNNFYTNTEPERIMWLINFMNSDKLDCPVNQLYDCLKEKYYIELEDYLIYCENNDCNDINYILFPRSIYWNENIDFNSLNYLYEKFNKVNKFSFGFILGK